MDTAYKHYSCRFKIGLCMSVCVYVHVCVRVCVCVYRSVVRERGREKATVIIVITAIKEHVPVLHIQY